VVTKIANDLAEDMLDQLLGEDLSFSLHLDNDGEVGDEADITVTNGRPTILTTEWSEPADAPIAGRLRDNVNEVDFGTATADETVAWICAHGANGQRACASLNPAKALTTGDPVKIPVGDLNMIVRGKPS